MAFSFHFLVVLFDFFSVCNEVPEQPVISQVSGAVFEKRLIEKYIAEYGIDPTNEKELTTDQLIDVKGILSKLYLIKDTLCMNIYNVYLIICSFFCVYI